MVFLVRDKFEMTPKERAKALENGESVDRLPCTPMISDHVSFIIGVSVKEYLNNPELMAKGHIKAFEIYGHDSVGLNPEIIGLPEAMGATVKYFKNSSPQIENPLIKRYEDVKLIKVVEAEKDGRLPLYFEALGLIEKEIGGKVRIATGIGGPFTTAALLRGADSFLVDTMKNPEFVHALMEITTKSVIKYMERAFQLGFSCSMGEPMASCSVISPAQFRKFVKPYIKEISDFSKKMRGKGPSIHICGRTEKIWEDLIETGISRLSLDEVIDLEEAKKKIGDRIPIAGNVSPTEILLNGTPEMVIEAAKECIRKAGDSKKGFTLSSGCTVATYTPIENIKALIRGAEIHQEI